MGTGLAGASAAVAAPAITLPVGCSVTALNAAINFSPSNTILVLKSGCVYVTSSALANVTRNLTIVGSNDTIRETGVHTTLHNLGADLAINNLTFTGGDGTTGEPGAIHNVGGTLSLTSTTFRDNTGRIGGAILNSSGGQVNVTSSTFADNHAAIGIGLGGGAIANTGSSNLSLISSTFADNSAGSGGAIYLSSGSLTITGGQTQFVDNDADGTILGTGAGGAIESTGTSSVNLTNATFSHNDANRGGGGVLLTAHSSSITNSGFSGNFSGRDGGAIWTSAMLNLSGDNIDANRAFHDGGGIFVDGGTTTLSNHTLVYANSAGNTGGGIRRNAGTVSLTNGSLVRGNFPNNCSPFFFGC